MSESKQVRVVIVTYNSAATIKKCLESVLSQGTDVSLETVVVDNNSSDETLNVLRQYPEVKVISKCNNVGFARACNEGISDAQAESILILNPDCELEPGSIKEMFSVLRNYPRAMAVGPRIVTPDGVVQRECARRLWTPVRYLIWSAYLYRLIPQWSPYLDQGDIVNPRPVEAISGACMMIRTSWLQKYGGFDEEMFMYSEDMDMCIRIHQTGYEVWYNPRSKCYHESGHSVRELPLHWAQRVHYGGQLAVCRLLRKNAGVFLGTAIFLAGFLMSHTLKAVVMWTKALTGQKGALEVARKYFCLSCWMRVLRHALHGQFYEW